MTAQLKVAKGTRKQYRRRTIPERLGLYVDKVLVDLMRFGRHAVDPKTGLKVYDDQGEPVYVPPTAADISAALKRLDQLGVRDLESSLRGSIGPPPGWTPPARTLTAG